MAATKLSLFNLALQYLGDARLASTADDIEARYVLDEVFDEAVAFVLRQAPWRFALKTVTLSTGGTALPGYSASYAFPADWLRTHAIFRFTSDGRECPLDLREQGTAISVNVGAPTMRYVASGFANPELAGNPWPEHFAQCVAAYLAFLAAERITGENGAQGRMSELFASLLPEAIRLDSVPESRWLEHQRSGAMLWAARQVLRTGPWHFAVKMAAPAADGTPAAGYAYSFRVPTDHLLTTGLFTIVGTTGREYPFDVREHGTHWSTNVTPIYARYVSTNGLDATLWPEEFESATLAFIELEQAKGEASEKAAALYQSVLAKGLASHGDKPSDWLPYQLDGSFLRGARDVLARGYWWWALKEVQLDQSTQLATTPDYGFPFRYALPSDHFRTHALFVPWDGLELPINIRESANDWSTDAGALVPMPGSVGSFVARYVSTDVLNAQTWPEIVAKAVLAFLDWQAAPEDTAKPLQAEFDRLLVEALAVHSRPEDPWLRHQLSGRYQHGLQQALESGRWRFAIRTISLDPSTDPLPAVLSDGTASAGYLHRFIRPNDWLRGMRAYHQVSSGVGAEELDVDYRDEGGALHANYTPLVIRYVSRLGLDATLWPALFRDALLAYLEYLEARAAPDMAAVADARLKFYREQMSQARYADERRDRVPLRDVGRIARARTGGGLGISRQQGWPYP